MKNNRHRAFGIGHQVWDPNRFMWDVGCGMSDVIGYAAITDSLSH